MIVTVVFAATYDSTVGVEVANASPPAMPARSATLPIETSADTRLPLGVNCDWNVAELPLIVAWSLV